MDVSELPLPPAPLRFMGDADDEKFLRIGGELAGLLRSRGLRDEDRLLDVGSGYGRLAIALMVTDFAGQYLGFDILKKHVRWCRQNLMTDPRYRFRHLDIVNARYNPNGTVEPADARFPCGDASHDWCALFSVFTHFYVDDIRHYLAEIQRVLVPGGRALTTWFLFDEDRIPAITSDRAAFGLVNELDSVTRFETTEDPLKAIGYEKDFVRGLVGHAGLRVLEMSHGTWAQDADDADHFQDLVLIEKPRPTAVRRALGSVKRRLRG